MDDDDDLRTRTTELTSGEIDLQDLAAASPPRFDPHAASLSLALSVPASDTHFGGVITAPITEPPPPLRASRPWLLPTVGAVVLVVLTILLLLARDVPRVAPIEHLIPATPRAP